MSSLKQQESNSSQVQLFGLTSFDKHLNEGGKFLESVLPLETLWIQLDLKHCTDLCTVGSLIGNIYTMWKFQDIYPTHILREINFGHFEELKTTILTILVLNFWQFLTFSNSKKSKFKASKTVKITVFDGPSVISQN